jgi:hypothetical protein
MGEISIRILVFTHSEVGTGQKVIKLKLRMGTGSITGVRLCQQALCVDFCYAVLKSPKLHSAIYFVIPVLLHNVGFACSVVVFVYNSYVVC